MCAWSCNSCAYGTFYTTHLSNILQFCAHTPREFSEKKPCDCTAYQIQARERHWHRLSHSKRQFNTQSSDPPSKFDKLRVFLVIYTQSFVKSKCKNHVHVYVWFSDVALTLFTCHGQQRGNWRQRSSLYSFSVVDWSQLTLSRRILGFIFFE